VETNRLRNKGLCRKRYGHRYRPIRQRPVKVLPEVWQTICQLVKRLWLLAVWTPLGFLSGDRGTGRLQHM